MYTIVVATIEIYIGLHGLMWVLLVLDVQNLSLILTIHGLM